MQSEKVNLVKSSGNEEIDIRLLKHTKYIVSYLNKSDINNSVRFFFEERFISEKNIASLLKTKEYGIIALQAFRYIGDLLGHLNIPQPNQEQCFYPERREYIQYISEPSSICLSPLRNESRDITPRDLVTEMMEGKTTEEEEYERINYLQQITSKTSKSANLKKGRQQDIASKVKSPQNSNKKALTSRIAKTAATTPQGHSPVKRLISKHQQSPDNLQSIEKNKYIQQSKFPPRLEIKQISYKELIGQHNQPLSSHRRFAENTERSQLDSERAILSLESARRRNTQKIKEADPHFKDPKGNVTKLNFGILGRRDAYKTENKFSNDETRILDPLKERIIEQNEKQLLTIGGSILKNSAYRQENISTKFKPLECADDEINTLRQRILEAQRRANSKSQEFLGLQIATNNQGLLKHDQLQDKNESQNPKSPNIEDTIKLKEKAFEASPQRMEKEKIKIVERTQNRCKSRQDERSGNEKRTERFVTFDGTDLQDFTYSDKEFHLIGRTPRKSPNGQQELKLQKDFEQINDKKINRNISSRKIELANTQICDILKETAIKSTK